MFPAVKEVCVQDMNDVRRWASGKKVNLSERVSATDVGCIAVPALLVLMHTARGVVVGDFMYVLLRYVLGFVRR